MNLTQKQKDNLIKLGIVRERLNFLNMPFSRKVTHIKSYVKFPDGLSFSDIEKLVKNVTVFYEKSLARDLEKIEDRKKLTYRSSGSIIQRNSNHSKFLIR